MNYLRNLLCFLMKKFAQSICWIRLLKSIYHILQNKEVFNYPNVMVGYLDINHFLDDERYNPSERAVSEAKANVSVNSMTLYGFIIISFIAMKNLNEYMHNKFLRHNSVLHTCIDDFGKFELI